MLKRLWNDEAGALVSAEIVLVATILVIGVVTGLSSVRDAVVEELADVGAAIGNVDQSYSVHGSTSHSAATSPFGFIDRPDFCDGVSSNDQRNSRCLVICNGAEVGTLTSTDNTN